VRDWLEQALRPPPRAGAAHWGRHHRRAEATLFASRQGEGYRVFAFPNVGRRFSVLSPPCLLPAALIGIEYSQARTRRRAHDATSAGSRTPSRTSRCARRSATGSSGPARQIHPGGVSLLNHLWGTAFWFPAALGRSLGKGATARAKEVHTGQTPVAALGTTDQHSQVQLYIEGPNDKVFTFWTAAKFSSAGRIPKRRFNLGAFDALAGRSLAELIDAERRATAAALVENGRPNCTVTLKPAWTKSTWAHFCK